MYKLDIKPTADKAFGKLAKKDKEQLRRVNYQPLKELALTLGGIAAMIRGW